MNLRVRLTVIALGVGLPMVAALVWLQRYANESAVRSTLIEIAQSQRQAGEKERCEANPQSWGFGHRFGLRPLDAHFPPDGPPPGRLGGRDGPEPDGPPPGRMDGPPPRPPGRSSENLPRSAAAHAVEVFAVGSDLASQHPNAPVLDASLTAGITAAEESRAGVVALREGTTSAVLVRSGWGAGPCEWILVVRRPPPPEPFAQRFSPWMFALIPTLAVVLALLIGMGPVVASVRRLRGQVIDAAKTGYLQPIALGPKDEIGELGGAFEQARQEIRRQFDELERRERTLREFLENTTHDVNIPLTVLLGHVAALQQRIASAQAVEPTLVTSMANEAHYMASLIHNLSAAAKLDSAAPRLHHERVDLTALVSRAVGRHLPIARQSSIALEQAAPEQPIIVLGDVTLIEQAVSNVVYNAVRHNRAGGHVAVILETPTPQRFSIKVLDDGPGIPEAELARLVERRFRGDDARSRDPSGQGLGLNITFQVAQVHGFELTFARSEFGGLEVRFQGPVAG